MSETRDVRISIEQEADYAFRIEFADTAITALHTDENPPLGGGTGPDPSRLLLAAIGNCLAASLLFALRKFRNEPGRLRADVAATVARNAAGRWRIPKAWVEIHLPEGGEQYQQLDRILGQFEDFCIVTQSVRDGVEVEVTVKDANGRVLLGDKSFEAGA